MGIEEITKAITGRNSIVKEVAEEMGVTQTTVRHHIGTRLDIKDEKLRNEYEKSLLAKINKKILLFTKAKKILFGLEEAA